VLVLVVVLVLVLEMADIPPLDQRKKFVAVKSGSFGGA
jgi:hypothetical protein